MTTPTPHHRILSLTIEGGGFLDGLKLNFADGLNCIIGGRGTGKTSALEVLRYALQADSEATPPSELVEANLDTARATVAITTAHGARYDVARAWDSPVEITAPGGVATTAAIDQLFPVDFLGQSEIQTIGKDDASRLRLIDRFAADEIRTLATAIASVQRDLAQTAADHVRLTEQERERSAEAVDSATLEEKLKGLSTGAGPEDKSLAAAHAASALRERERQALAAVKDAVGKTRSDAQRFAQALSRRFADVVDDAILRGPNNDLVGAIHARLAKAASAFQEHLAKIAEASEIADADIQRESLALVSRHTKQEEAYRAQLAKDKEEAGRAAERRQLQQRLAAALTAQKQLQHLQTERHGVEQRRSELLGRLSELRDECYVVRRGVAERLTAQLAPNVRVSIRQAGGKAAYAAFLTERLKGSGLQYKALVKKIVEAVGPAELGALARRGDAATLSERASIDDRAGIIVGILAQGTTLFDLETIEIADLAIVELLDGSYKDSRHLSPGQRATAILPILLIESERPLVLDQPEDHLDPRFLVDVIVATFRKAKLSRQVIVITHTPNIPVLGDAERVFAFAGDGHRSQLRAVGTVDEIRDEVQELEGGAVAFKTRKDRYGY